MRGRWRRGGRVRRGRRRRSLVALALRLDGRLAGLLLSQSLLLAELGAPVLEPYLQDGGVVEAQKSTLLYIAVLTKDTLCSHILY